jgi:hypothetical protein
MSNLPELQKSILSYLQAKPESEREASLLETSPLLVQNGHPLDEVEAIIRGVGQDCRPPLSEEAVKAAMVGARHALVQSEASEKTVQNPNLGKEKPSAFNVMLNLFRSTGAMVFKDKHGKVWAFVYEDGIYKPVPVGGTDFFRRCLALHHEATGEAVGKETVEKVGALLANTDVTFDLHNRFAQEDGRIFIDLGTNTWEVVEIKADGCEVTRVDRPLFCRQNHQKALPMPEPGGNVREILQFLPIKDEESQLLILVWLCSVPLALVPRPGIIIHGLHGSGKSSTAEFLRGVLDPSSTPTLSLSSSSNDFVQMMDHHAILSLDNVQSLPQWVSDNMCRAVTGGGYSKRVLYTDDDEFSYQFMRTFIINGISIAASSPDLLDRSILIELDRISQDERTEIHALREAYEKAKGRIFGDICNTLSRAITIRAAQENVRNLPRMADWCRWGMCIAEALGYSQEDFYKAYMDNKRIQDQEVVSGEPVCQALLAFLQARNDAPWEGTAALLYTDLTDVAMRNGLRDKDWPRAANAFARKLKGLRHNLEEVGYGVSERKSHGTKLIKVRKI